MSINAGEVAASLILKTDGFESGLKSAKAMMSGFTRDAGSLSDRLNAIATTMNGIGRGLTMGVTAPIVAAGTAAVVAFTSLDDGVRKVASIADSSQLTMEQITSGLLDMSARTNTAATNLAEGMYQVISATGDTANALDYTEVAAKAAIAGFTDTATAVDGLTTVMNVYGMSGGEAMQRVADMMLMTQNYGKTTFGELSSSIGQVIPIASQMGVGIDTVLAAVASLTKNGLSTASAMTGLRGAFSNIIKPTADAQKAAKELGIDFSASAMQAKGLTGFLRDIQEAAGGDTEVMARLFGSVEGLNAMLSLTSDTGMAAYLEGLNQIGNSGGMVEQAYSTMESGIGGSFRNLKTQVQSLAAEFGENLAPAVQKGADFVGSLVEKFRSLSESQQDTIIKIAAVAAAIGPLLIVVSKLINAVTTIKAAVASLSMGPVGWIVAGVTAATVATVGLVNAYKDAKKEWEQNQKADMNLGVDVSDIEHIDVPEISVDVESVDITYQGEKLSAQIIEWLTDGLPETPEECDEYVKRVTDSVSGCFESIQAQYDQDVAVLKAKLDAGLITPEEFEQQTKDLKDKADAQISELQSAQDAVTEYITTAVANGETLTEEQIAELQELIDKLFELGAAAGLASDQVTAPYEAAYNKVRAGMGSEEDRVMAVQYVEMVRKTKTDAIEANRETINGGYDADIAAAGDDMAEVTRLANEQADAMAALDGQVQMVNEDINAMYAPLLRQEMEGAGISEDMLREFAELPEKIAEARAKVEEMMGSATSMGDGQTYSAEEIEAAQEELAALEDQYESLSDTISDATYEDTGLTELLEDMAGIGAIDYESDGFTTFTDAVLDFLDEVPDSASSAAGAMANVKSELSTGGTSTASEFHRRFASGINAGATIIRSAGVSYGNTFLDGVRSSLNTTLTGPTIVSGGGSVSYASAAGGSGGTSNSSDKPVAVKGATTININNPVLTDMGGITRLSTQLYQTQKSVSYGMG